MIAYTQPCMHVLSIIIETHFSGDAERQLHSPGNRPSETHHENGR